MKYKYFINGNWSPNVFEKDYFEGRTSNYTAGYRDYEPYFDFLIKKILAKRPSSVLEIGCAYGFIIKRLLRRGIFAVGIDVSEWATKQGISPNIIRASATHLPFKDKTFDLCFSNDVLDHIHIASIEQVVKEITRVSHRAYHIISCKSLEDDRDITHKTMMPINWWRERLPSSFTIEEKDTKTALDNLRRIWQRILFKLGRK